VKRARVCALFSGRKYRPLGIIRDREVWISRELELELALEMANGMRAAGVRRVWVESAAAPAHVNK
jgi:hypothetical protein